MKTKLTLTSAICVLLVFTNLSFATTILPLNSGYDHWWGTAYGTSPSPGTLPQPDNYWINVTNSTPIPSFAISKISAWQGPFPNTQWVNFQNSWQSPPNVPPTKFFVYRKCFCLQKGFAKPSITLDIRADDMVGVWLNSASFPIVNFANGQFSGAPLHGSTTNGFKTGSNCVFVVVADVWGVATGFNLTGDVTAVAGLLSTPAKGPNKSYAPCGCEESGGAGALRTDGGDDDKKAIQEIVKNAEAKGKSIQLPRPMMPKN